MKVQNYDNSSFKQLFSKKFYHKAEKILLMIVLLVLKIYQIWKH